MPARYRRAWDFKLNMFQNKPLHNRVLSHGADAFRMLAIGIDRSALCINLIGKREPSWNTTSSDTWEINDERGR